MREAPRRPEFSRPLDVRSLEDGVLDVEIEAEPGERAALAERFALVALDRLAASLRVRALAEPGLYRLAGHLAAEVVQSCVVTLEPVASRMEEDFEVLFSEHPPAPPHGAVEIGPDEEDPPEAVVDGFIEAGEAVAEQLALALDPYPRAAGVTVESLGYGARISDNDGGEGQSESPFAVLAKLRKGPKER